MKKVIYLFFPQYLFSRSFVLFVFNLLLFEGFADYIFRQPADTNVFSFNSYLLFVLAAPVQKTVVITPEEFNKLKAEGILKFPQPAAQRPVQIISSTAVANPTVQVDNEVVIPDSKGMLRKLVI